jgi:hypothetical protein
MPAISVSQPERISAPDASPGDEFDAENAIGAQIRL